MVTIKVVCLEKLKSFLPVMIMFKLNCLCDLVYHLVLLYHIQFYIEEVIIEVYYKINLKILKCFHFIVKVITVFNLFINFIITINC